jgi:predicted TIM-barrel fold metal-dependent hydrolase
MFRGVSIDLLRLEVMRMVTNGIAILDCDGHVMESLEEMAEYAPPSIREFCVNPQATARDPFPTLDGLHFPDPAKYDGSMFGSNPVLASDHRRGSGQDWVAFLEKANVQESVLFPTDGLTIGFVRDVGYVTALCRTYNDYVADCWGRASNKLHPMALIPMQSPKAAVEELRRAVRELNLPGAMLPATGLPLHLAHEFYWPVYEEAANLGCVLAVHGGANWGIGLDTFTSLSASHILHHPMPLMISSVAMLYEGLFDRLPDLRVAFMEGGASWPLVLMDRMERDSQYFGSRRGLAECMQSGQVLIGCEGAEPAIGYLRDRVGIESFAYASDYPHEVDMRAATHEIEEIMEKEDLSHDDKAAILGGNTRRFFRL